jgi:membrane protease YdiL (CAAX protease family)
MTNPFPDDATPGPADRPDDVPIADPAFVPDVIPVAGDETASENFPVAEDVWPAEPASPPPKPAIPPRDIPYIAAPLLILGLVLGYLAVQGRRDAVVDFIVSGVTCGSLMGLALFAYAGARHDWAKVVTLVYWLLVLGAASAGAMVCTGMAVLDLSKDRQIRLFPGGGQSLALTAAGCFCGLLIGLLCFVYGVRRQLSYVLPMQPDSFVHATALATVVALTVIAAVPLLVLGDPPFLMFIDHVKDNPKMAEELAAQDTLAGEIYFLLWLLPSAVVAVGFPLARSIREALRRLALVRPTWTQVLFGVGTAVVLVFAMTWVDHGITSLWESMGWPTTNSRLLEDLLRFAISPIGAVVIGLVAGLGEELAIRGVLQPRLGILVSNLFFTAAHAFQYNLDALLSVFLVGLLFGVIRKRTNTSTCALVHGLYDCLLILLMYWEVPWFTE